VIPGIERFKGPRVQAQFFDTNLDWTDKEVVIIGSGATAVTIVPVMAKAAKQVTMLQRSPSYLMSSPSEDGFESFFRRWLPATWAHTLIRWKWLWFGWTMVKLCKYFPTFVRTTIKGATIAELPEHIKHDPHFEPKYMPWQQRMCFCPNGDFFEAMRNRKANIVTGVIDNVTEDAINLRDGQVLKPDIIVSFCARLSVSY
jgi:cation diffusion facilitator CzcD-associated flavoprotein CzcO